jgi:flagellar hook assembly protein FlgD
MIRYDVPAPGGEVTIEIFDVSGRHVRTLVSGAERPGQRAVSWDGRDDRGRPVGSGVYYYRLEADGFRATRKLMFLK